MATHDPIPTLTTRTQAACSLKRLLIPVSLLSVVLLVSVLSMLDLVPESLGEWDQARVLNGADVAGSINTTKSNAGTLKNGELTQLQVGNFPKKMLGTYDGEYNKILPEKKYLLFQWSGGFNNQRVILQRALRMAKYMGRVAVVPMLATHVSMWYPNYMMEAKDGKIPMDLILDFPHMHERGYEVMALNITLKEFVTQVLPKRYDSKEIYQHSHTAEERKKKPLKSSGIKRMKHRAQNKKFLYLGKGTMWQEMWHDAPAGPEFDEVPMKSWVSIRFAPYLQGVARRLVDGIGDFNCIHVRMGDYENRQMGSKGSPGRRFLKKVEDAKFSEVSSKLYVATEPREDYASVFGPLMKSFDVMFSRDLDPTIIAEVDANLEANGYPGWHGVRNDVLGNVEQLVCAMAGKFIGTQWSTFSQFIRKMRRKSRYRYLVPGGSGVGPINERPRKRSLAPLEPDEAPSNQTNEHL